MPQILAFWHEETGLDEDIHHAQEEGHRTENSNRQW
jgi:hypothetical protein